MFPFKPSKFGSCYFKPQPPVIRNGDPPDSSGGKSFAKPFCAYDPLKAIPYPGSQAESPGFDSGSNLLPAWSASWFEGQRLREGATLTWVSQPVSYPWKVHHHHHHDPVVGYILVVGYRDGPFHHTNHHQLAHAAGTHPTHGELIIPGHVSSARAKLMMVQRPCLDCWIPRKI